MEPNRTQRGLLAPPQADGLVPSRPCRAPLHRDPPHARAPNLSSSPRLPPPRTPKSSPGGGTHQTPQPRQTGPKPLARICADKQQIHVLSPGLLWALHPPPHSGCFISRSDISSNQRPPSHFVPDLSFYPSQGHSSPPPNREALTLISFLTPLPLVTSRWGQGLGWGRGISAWSVNVSEPNLPFFLSQERPCLLPRDPSVTYLGKGARDGEGGLDMQGKWEWRDEAKWAGVPGTPGSRGSLIPAVCVSAPMCGLVINGCHYMSVTVWGGGRGWHGSGGNLTILGREGAVRSAGVGDAWLPVCGGHCIP